MKTVKILASIGILSLFLSSMGCGGSHSGQSSDQPDLIGGLGTAFGMKQEKIDLLKKGVGVVQALEPIGEAEEITLGEAVALEAFSRFGGEYQNKEWTRYINLVGQTIAEVSDRPNLPFRFAILNSQEQNAFAAPGGYIFITVGLLKTLKNEAELAGVLAHEVAHVTERHMLETIRRGAILGSVSEFTLTAMRKDPAMFSNVIEEMSELLFTKGLDRDKEFEADVVGIEYAYRAGYHPQGLRDYLKTLAREEGKVQSRFFTTHPSTNLRISKIDGLLKDYTDIKNLPFLTDRFQRYVKAG
jgi:beta-barrel assembly-enhancing protease